MSMASYPN
uniref:Uncharacterized protein n=1 Tax=Anguilla anguilla TaxID=7936 RepID=A0A0E9S2U9_ANGAN